VNNSQLKIKLKRLTMKKILLTLIVLSFTASTIAQLSYDWTLNDSIVTDIDADSYTELKIEQTNISGNDLDLGIEIVYNDIPSSWDGMVCIEGICLGTIPVVGTTAQMSPIADNAFGYVRLTANPMGGLEQITLRVKVYDLNNPADADTATWVINSVSTAGISELNEESTRVSVFPNPTSTYFSIASDLTIDKIELISLDGKIMYSQPYTKNSTINIEDLPTALYFVNMYSETKLVGVKKLTKND
jgi:hypothetical protein